ncbi:MAG: hypothetical protein J0L88_06690 [Xanthomonadales bacterium]|nr:hypothetical protein [Xanthomonadales bacterium]
MSNARETHSSVEDAAHTVAGKIGDGIDEATRTASRFGERLRANGAVLQEELGDAGERLAEGAKRIGDIAAEQIRAHPLAAFGIAFAVGVLTTRMLRR